MHDASCQDLNGSDHVMSHIWMSTFRMDHVTHESCHTHEWVMSNLTSRMHDTSQPDAHISESYHTYG